MDTCVNLDNDVNNCGECGKVCADPTPYCVDGACAECESAELSFCDGAGCVNLQTDASNCGSCGSSCSGATPYCSATGCVEGMVIDCTNGTLLAGNSSGTFLTPSSMPLKLAFNHDSCAQQFDVTVTTDGGVDETISNWYDTVSGIAGDTTVYITTNNDCQVKISCTN